MKRLKILSLAVLLSFVMIGFAFSAQIPDVTQPQAGSEKWSMSVFNNSSSALDDGDIVIWDIDSSTGDAFMYVNTTATANTGPIAGVVQGAISAKSVGSITIYGLDTVDVISTFSSSGPGQVITTSGTTGSGQAGGSTSDYIVGHLQQSVTLGAGSAVIFVNPGMGQGN